jgi:glutamate formiminotransferase
MTALIECVPNVANGRDPRVTAELRSAIASSGAKLLHTDSSTHVDRTVFTVVGSAEAVIAGAVKLIAAAAEHIDLNKYQSSHPHIGAVDICPFVPLHRTSLEDSVKCAREAGERIAAQLEIPVFLYGRAASTPERRTTNYFRRGGCVNLSRRMESGETLPDYGPKALHPTAGGVIVGARPILIAYNVNLRGATLQHARVIAGRLRAWAEDESGKGPRLLQALGWFLPELNICQVSTNILDYRRFPIHEVYERTRREAQTHGAAVSASELVGLVPREALLAAGAHFSPADAG